MKEFFLTTDRIGFSHWAEGDIDLALSLWGEPEVTRYICASGVFSPEDVANRLNTEISNLEQYGVQYFPFFELDSGDLIGCCGLRPYKDLQDTYEIGFHLRKEYWHRNLGYEAAKAMIAYAFEELKAAELRAGHNPNNAASRKLLTRLGFEYEADEFYPPTGLHHPSYSLKR